MHTLSSDAFRATHAHDTPPRPWRAVAWWLVVSAAVCWALLSAPVEAAIVP